jgi:hypothetical protein
MHLYRMVPHSVLAREGTITFFLTAIAVTLRTPKDSFLNCMSSVIVSVEVIPSAERALAAFWDSASKYENARVAGSLYYANIGDGGVV